MSSLAGDVDRISALPDDLLHLILTFVCEAKEVTRTAVLSRRWRRVWIHAQHLVIYETRSSQRSTEPGGQLVGFVDWVLAQRGDADIGSLAIVTVVPWPSSPEQFNGWLRYAARRVVKSLRLRIHLPYRRGHPYSAAAAAAAVAPAEDLRVLDVTAPDLRVLTLKHCFSDWCWRAAAAAADHAVREVVRVAAPRLQEIETNSSSFTRCPDLDIHDLTSVRRLSGLRLNMHGQYCAPASTEVSFWLLDKVPQR
ncbi:hypothetical protein PVAP13_3NG193926 [Panicum virgatum]|uniref:F-box domain-containing protein n=1 Tax=Panicum virgatum TaxID=38727 RepID=A0A8T0U9P7_PANVG|nr:hypothetical protein PVAP13_3NG193926 [Panicum virgatum]